MRFIIRFVAVVCLVTSGLATSVRQVYAANLDTKADRVFGHQNFSSWWPNNEGVTASSLLYPQGLSVDIQGNLYVADEENNRVLEYKTPLTSDTTADRVFGQPDFTSNSVNNGGVSASSLLYPMNVAVDAHGNLYVADTFNNRVLEYDLVLFKVRLPFIRR